MADASLKGRTALVTGASSGIGEWIARELAARGASLILVARREDRLQTLAKELDEKHQVACEVIASDLGRSGAPQALFERLQGRAVDILINNAGFGLHGQFADLPWARQREMLEVDVVALTHLTHLFVGPMVARGYGRILQVSSIGAFQPCPSYASYGAAKSYVLQFAEALNVELAGTGVSCTALCPGVTVTEFFQVAGQKPSKLQRATQMTAEEVARIGVQAMLRGKGSVVPGWLNALTAWFVRFLPRRTAAVLAAKTVAEDRESAAA